MRLTTRFCRKATRLILLRADRRLGPFERLVVRLHLRVCTMCTRLTGQVRLMERAMGQWKAYGEVDGSEAPPG